MQAGWQQRRRRLIDVGWFLFAAWAALNLWFVSREVEYLAFLVPYALMMAANAQMMKKAARWPYLFCLSVSLPLFLLSWAIPAMMDPGEEI